MPLPDDWFQQVGRKQRLFNEMRADRQGVTRELKAVYQAERELRATGVTYEVELTIDLLCRLAQ